MLSMYVCTVYVCVSSSRITDVGTTERDAGLLFHFYITEMTASSQGGCALFCYSDV